MNPLHKMTNFSLKLVIVKEMITIAGSVVICCVIFFVSCKSPKPTDNEVNNNSLETNTYESVIVTTQRTKLGSFTIQTMASGILRAPSQSRLSFHTSGTINKITVHDGSLVREGQILAYLDDREQRMALRLAQDQAAEARVQLRALIAEYGGRELDTASLQPNARSFVLTKSGYYKSQTAIAQARQQLEFTILRAPYAGIVANLSAKPFNFISSYEILCMLLGRAEMQIEFSVLESELAIIQVGQSVRIKPMALQGRAFAGTITEINPLVSAQGLVLVRAIINRPERLLFEGMNARVVIERHLAKQLVVPKSSIVERNGRKVLFTVEEGRAKWHYVTVSSENEQDVAISEGLDVNEHVIVSGNINIAHNATVVVKNR